MITQPTGLALTPVSAGKQLRSVRTGLQTFYSSKELDRLCDFLRDLPLRLQPFCPRNSRLRYIHSPPLPHSRPHQPRKPPLKTKAQRSCQAAVRLGNAGAQPSCFFKASKLFEKEQFEQALADYRQAAKLDPSNPNYALAGELARSHSVTALLQSAVKDRNRSDASAERQALARSLALDPGKAQVIEHLHELADQAALAEPQPIYGQTGSGLGEAVTLAPDAGVHDFHLRIEQRQAIQQVFKAYGIDATVDESVHPIMIRLDLEGANFEQAAHVLSLMTNSFYVPIDAHRALKVACTYASKEPPAIHAAISRDHLPARPPANGAHRCGKRSQEHIPELTAAQAAVERLPAGTITVRAPEKTLAAFNATIQDLIAGHNQVMLDVRLMQLAHNSGRDTGIQPPPVDHGVQRLCRRAVHFSTPTRLPRAADYLLRPGCPRRYAGDPRHPSGIRPGLKLPCSPMEFSPLFGGGLTLSGISPKPITTDLNLNSSESRAVSWNTMQLRA